MQTLSNADRSVSDRGISMLKAASHSSSGRIFEYVWFSGSVPGSPPPPLVDEQSMSHFCHFLLIPASTLLLPTVLCAGGGGCGTMGCASGRSSSLLSNGRRDSCTEPTTSNGDRFFDCGNEAILSNIARSCALLDSLSNLSFSTWVAPSVKIAKSLGPWGYSWVHQIHAPVSAELDRST